jgi:hypothetical protein
VKKGGGAEAGGKCHAGRLKKRTGRPAQEGRGETGGGRREQMKRGSGMKDRVEILIPHFPKV